MLHSTPPFPAAHLKITRMDDPARQDKEARSLRDTTFKGKHQTGHDGHV